MILGSDYDWFLSDWSKSENFDQSGIWTHDLGMSRPTLYQLSYLVMVLLPFSSSLVSSVASRVCESVTNL